MILEPSTPLTVDSHVHDTSDFAPKLVDYSVSSQISKYSFVTPLIEDEIYHETVDSSIITSSGPSKLSPPADYNFMIVPDESFSSKSSEFLAMIQQVFSSAFSFTGCLEFISESSLPLAGFDVSS